MGLPPRAGPEPLRGPSPAVREGLLHLMTDLVAAGPDARAEAYPHLRWPGPEPPGHLSEHPGKDPLPGPPPSGVYDAKGGPSKIHHQDGHAVRGGDNQADSRPVGDQGVSHRGRLRLRSRRGHMDPVGVALPQPVTGEVRDPQRRRKSGPGPPIAPQITAGEPVSQPAGPKAREPGPAPHRRRLDPSHRGTHDRALKVAVMAVTSVITQLDFWRARWQSPCRTFSHASRSLV